MKALMPLLAVILLPGCSTVAVWDKTPEAMVPLTCAFHARAASSVQETEYVGTDDTGVKNYRKAEGCYYYGHWQFHVVADPKDGYIVHVLEHECKHKAKGNFHGPYDNGDESDLGKYAACADSLLKTGRYTGE